MPELATLGFKLIAKRLPPLVPTAGPHAKQGHWTGARQTERHWGRCGSAVFRLGTQSLDQGPGTRTRVAAQELPAGPCIAVAGPPDWGTQGPAPGY